MRNYFLAPLPTSQLFGFGSNEFGMGNTSDSYSMLDNKINVRRNCFLSLPNGADIELGNLGGLPIANNHLTADYDDIGGYGCSSNTTSTILQSSSSSLLNNHCVSHSTQGKRKRSDGEESYSHEKMMKSSSRRKPIHHHHQQLTHQYNQLQQQQQVMPVRRSQKIGDRITALQKLVSPYGKTDTASVLQEATLYIKLLEDQIQNQFQIMGSPSYGSSSFNNTSSLQPKDLRSRGLCLIPVSSILNKDDVHTQAA